MGIRKPSLSVNELRNLADVRSSTNSGMPEKGKQEPGSHEIEKNLAPLQSPIKPSLTAAKGLTATANAKKDKNHEVDAAPKKQKEKILQARPRQPVWKAPSSNSSTFNRHEHGKSSAFEQVYIKKAQIYVSAELPAPGVSETYDLVCQHYPPQKALQMIMRKALQDYDFVLESGKFSKLAETYPVDESAAGYFVQTSRMMSKGLYRVARAHFDPLGLESTRSFGRKLATAALATFFSHELKQSNSLALLNS